MYLHRRATDGAVFYVGKGKGRRAWDKRRGYNAHWHRVAVKHGVIVEIYKDGMSECCAMPLESVLIGIIGIDNLTNITLGGGHSGYEWTDEQIAKKSGENHFNYGKKLSKETIGKISKSQSGKNHHNYGGTISDRQKAEISKRMSGTNHPMFGKHHTYESRRKISEAHKGVPKPVGFSDSMKKPIQTECGMTFDSVSSAVVWLKANGKPKAHTGSISRCASGVKYYNTAYGYRWSFVTRHLADQPKP